MQVRNGVPAGSAGGLLGQEPRHQSSGSSGEVAEQPDGAIAVRRSRYPSAPALIYTRAEVAAFLTGGEERRVR
jgi:Domain of unknown function (DUF397)